jgi:FkbM family methyltransferase
MKKYLKKIINYFGFDVIRLKSPQSEVITPALAADEWRDKNALIVNGFNLLKQKGFSPKHVVDVGANHGTWARELLKVFPKANYTLIEPQAWLSESFSDLLQQPNFTFLPIGVGKEQGEFLFTLVERDDSCNFIATEQEAIENGYKQISVKVDTINNIVKHSKFGYPDLLKIDAEGLDLEVIEGSTDILGKTEVILLEAAVVNPYFRNDIHAVIHLMNEKGYKLFDITDLNRPLENKVLWLVELLFVLKNGRFDKTNWIN